jgi:hypothetical protein
MCVQAFLALRFARPALQLPEPNVLRVDVAPISVAYSQACFSAVLAFVDAAWPAAAYDPLRVLASVTLANTVQVLWLLLPSHPRYHADPTSCCCIS